MVKRLRGVHGIDLHCVDASERFLSALEGVSDPEKKRKTIGGLFIDVFQEEVNRYQSETENERNQPPASGLLRPHAQQTAHPPLTPQRASHATLSPRARGETHRLDSAAPLTQRRTRVGARGARVSLRCVRVGEIYPPPPRVVDPFVDDEIAYGYPQPNNCVERILTSGD